MTHYLHLVKEYNKVHKRENKMTLVSIIIAVFLVTTVFGMAEMEIKAQKTSIIKQYGNWHVMFKDITNEQAKLISARPETAYAGWIFSIGKSGGYTLKGKPIYPSGADKEMAKQFGIQVQEGNYPTHPNEMLINISAKERLKLAIGDDITINTADKKIITFKISGFSNDVSSLLKFDGYGSILTPEGMKNNFPENSYPKRFYLQFKPHKNMQNTIDDIFNELSIEKNKVQQNKYLMAALGQSKDSYVTQLYSIAGVLFILILVAAILMIASSFNTTVMKRIRFFGLMRCIGASKSQVKRYVLYEGLRFSFKAIPIGLLSGTVTVWILSAFLRNVNPTYFSEMPVFNISLISLISGASVGFLSVILASFSPSKKASRVSPLSAINGQINQSNNQVYKKSANIKGKKVEIAMGMYHAYMRKKNLFLMVASFSISIVLFLCFSVGIDFMNQAIKPARPWTPDLSIISKNNTQSIPTDMLNKVMANPDVKRAYGRAFSYSVPVIVDQCKGIIDLVSYERNQFKWSTAQLVGGDIKTAVEGNGNVLVVYSDDLQWKVGDKIKIFTSHGTNTVNIVGILATSPFDKQKGKQTVICNEDTFKGIIGKSDYTIIDIQLNKNATKENIIAIRDLAKDYVFSDQRSNNEEVRAARFSFSVFVYGFLVCIASITVFNIINSMNMSISAKRKEYGYMRAIGMSIEQLKRTIIAEAATYAILGCIVGCIVGLPLHRSIFIQVITARWGLPWVIPIHELIIIIFLVIIATYVSIIGPINKIRKLDIVANITEY
ncbi:ABC transporter permease [Clostridium tetanomorphum]|uniref:FtsX-like permease family protein n=1 Tax=Clostridium tetanomorphum TaxID=1553 RepID=A0A923EA54_CLOTT|nr:FtsX-like permease family protein [Clostridium tetanomorphum]MBC2397924.1 FtsX-like permease family protein [Clostridium tetanomorphum]NRZ97154.1 putative ABC transport system permease protein [Clostridium tetanomorphum]